MVCKNHTGNTPEPSYEHSEIGDSEDSPSRATRSGARGGTLCGMDKSLIPGAVVVAVFLFVLVRAVIIGRRKKRDWYDRK